LIVTPRWGHARPGRVGPPSSRRRPATAARTERWRWNICAGWLSPFSTGPLRSSMRNARRLAAVPFP